MKFTTAFAVFALAAVAAVHAAPSPLAVDVGAGGNLSVGVQTPKVNVTLNAGGNVTTHVDTSSNAKLAEAAKAAGVDLAQSPLSFGDFQKAVTAAGLPVPSADMFLDFLKPLLGPGGTTVITAAQIALKLAEAITKGVFGTLSTIKADDVLSILAIVTKVLAGGIKGALQ
ncbi:hypothetical protein GQ42DRAFT_165167 [Ramicandelaber brevisporus]|nr:hypothetical protein GQ42DRAFT_165167 [Ramicandelaber brevisporus]